jgi:jumonji domain-containing protein 7
MTTVSSDDPIVGLLKTYHELNCNSVQELQSEPSALEFMRFVARNRPFVVRRAARDWTAVKKWDAEYLRRVLKGQEVQVAVTPKG